MPDPLIDYESECERLRDLVEDLCVWIGAPKAERTDFTPIQFRRPLPDVACAECYVKHEGIIPGFRCAYHRAMADAKGRMGQGEVV